MKPRGDYWTQLGTLAIGALMLVLLWGLWRMLANTSGEDGYPAEGVRAVDATQPSAGYPGPIASPFPSTATPLPDPGIRLGNIERLSGKAGGLPLMPADGRPHFIYPATDSNTLVGVVVTGTKPFGYLAAVDLATGKSQRIADVWSPGNPQVSGQYVVWTDQGRLYVYDQVSAKTEQLTIGDAARDLSLSGSIVVWENISQGQTLGIWGYDLTAGKDFPVVKTTATKARKPLISGQWVLYQSAGYKDGETRIGLNVMNMDTGEGLELGELPYLKYYVPRLYAIDVPWVAWSAYEWGVNPTLYLYNVDTRTFYTVAVPGCGLDELHQGNINRIVVSGVIVLFRGCYQSAGMGYDIERGKFFSVLITRAESQEAAFVDWAFARGRLVWSMTVGPRWQEQTQVYAAPIIRDRP